MGNELSELIIRRSAWKHELTKILGIQVKDIELADDTVAYAAVRNHGVLIFDRDTPTVSAQALEADQG